MRDVGSGDLSSILSYHFLNLKPREQVSGRNVPIELSACGRHGGFNQLMPIVRAPMARLETTLAHIEVANRVPNLALRTIIGYCTRRNYGLANVAPQSSKPSPFQAPGTLYVIVHEKSSVSFGHGRKRNLI